MQSFEPDPYVFQVVREKQIKVQTATAHHVFSAHDATVLNSSPLDSNEKLIVLSPEIVKSTDVASQNERATHGRVIVRIRIETLTHPLGQWTACLFRRSLVIL